MQVSGHKLCKKNKTIHLPKVDHLHCFVVQVHAGGPILDAPCPQFPFQIIYIRFVIP